MSISRTKRLEKTLKVAADYWMIGLTAAIAITSLLQWRAISGQLDEMKRGGVDTHDLALAAKLDQRAWIGLSHMTVEPLKAGSSVKGSVTFVNSGRTPAKDASPLIHMKYSRATAGEENELLQWSNDGATPKLIFGAVYPGVPVGSVVGGDNQVKVLDEADLTQIASGYTYIWGEVSYTDMFDAPHRMEFCGYRQGLTGDFTQCPFHNRPEAHD
jgi:hypothetical protein